MVTGIGMDLVEIDRVIKACQKTGKACREAGEACQGAGFLKRYYTEAEIRLIGEDLTKAADNFAVKEAVSKMLGTGFRGFTPIDIEVLRDSNGKPFVNLYGAAKKLAKEQGISAIHVSIANTRVLSGAYVIGERL